MSSCLDTLRQREGDEEGKEGGRGSLLCLSSSTSPLEHREPLLSLGELIRVKEVSIQSQSEEELETGLSLTIRKRPPVMQKSISQPDGIVRRSEEDLRWRSRMPSII
jgi:hypothetical protein